MPALIRAVGREIPGCSAAGGCRHPGAAAAGPRWHLHGPQGCPGSHSFTSVYSMDLEATGLEQAQKSTFFFFGSTLT